MDYSMQGSKDSSSPQVHNHLYPDAQPGLYPPPPPAPPPAMANPPQGGYGYGYQYQGYLGEAANPPPPYYYTGSWPEQPPAPSDGAPFRYRYLQDQDDANCITFLRGCLAGLCCCCLLERCCI
uniref:Annexin A7 n=1 Tax=Zea mays TaxID=4577 RepID=B6SLH4_MAIZE|nr:annexin A7 [Zea mays]